MRKRPAKMPAPELLAAIRSAVESGAVQYADHALQRLQERSVTMLEVEQILRLGHREPKKDEWKPEYDAWSYAMRGKTDENRSLRVAVAIEEPGVLVVTVIDLDKKDLA